MFATGPSSFQVDCRITRSNPQLICWVPLWNACPIAVRPLVGCKGNRVTSLLCPCTSLGVASGCMPDDVILSRDEALLALLISPFCSWIWIWAPERTSELWNGARERMKWALAVWPKLSWCWKSSQCFEQQYFAVLSRSPLWVSTGKRWCLSWAQGAMRKERDGGEGRKTIKLLHSRARCSVPLGTQTADLPRAQG